MTQLELERLASLASHPGYQALLKILDEADDILLAELETTGGPKETELLNLWRASRRFRKLIAGRPEALLEELGHMFNDRVL